MRGTNLNNILSRFVTTDTEQTITAAKTFFDKENHTPIFLKSENDDEIALSLMYEKSAVGAVGWESASGVYIFNSKGQRLIGINDEGKPIYGRPKKEIEYEILHSGNLSQYINSSAIKTQSLSTDINEKGEVEK